MIVTDENIVESLEKIKYKYGFLARSTNIDDESPTYSLGKIYMLKKIEEELETIINQVAKLIDKNKI